MLKNRSGQVAAGCWDNAPAAQNQKNSAQRWHCLQVQSSRGVVGGQTLPPSQSDPVLAVCSRLLPPCRLTVLG